MSDRDDPRKTFGAILDRGVFADHPPATTPEADVSPFNSVPGDRRETRGGVQWKFSFGNGYGASVVRHSFSYGHEAGLWELAVLAADGHLTYATPLTDDVIGWVDENTVADLLAKIEALPS